MINNRLTVEWNAWYWYLRNIVYACHRNSCRFNTKNSTSNFCFHPLHFRQTETRTRRFIDEISSVKTCFKIHLFQSTTFIFNTIYTISRDKYTLVHLKAAAFCLNHCHCDTFSEQMVGRHTHKKRITVINNAENVVANGKKESNPQPLTESDTWRLILLLLHSSTDSKFGTNKFPAYFISSWYILRELQFTMDALFIPYLQHEWLVRKKPSKSTIFITIYLLTKFNVVWHLKPIIVLIWNYFAAYKIIQKIHIFLPWIYG